MSPWQGWRGSGFVLARQLSGGEATAQRTSQAGSPRVTQPFIAKQLISIMGTLWPALPVILLKKHPEMDGWAFLAALQDWR
jgi:hypothetical protein